MNEIEKLYAQAKEQSKANNSHMDYEMSAEESRLYFSKLSYSPYSSFSMKGREQPR